MTITQLKQCVVCGKDELYFVHFKGMPEFTHEFIPVVVNEITVSRGATPGDVLPWKTKETS